MARRTADEAHKTRVAIVAAARHLFGTRGFAATSTSAVVAAAGVTRGALYHHFVDKSDLFRAVFVEIEHEMNDTVATAALATSNALDAFLAGIDSCLDFMTRADYRQIAVVDGPSVLGLLEWHEIDTSIGLATMQVGLDALDREGRLRVPSSPALAMLLFGALTEAGIAISRGDPATPSRAQLREALVALVLEPG
jgi:AcrR family transcriptional regulator